MNKFKFSNYKLPHMKSAFLKNNKEIQPEINRNFPRLEIKVPEGKGRYNAAVKQTVSSAGTATDSIRSIQAFKDEVKNYMDREFKGNNPKLGRITPEENFREAMGELSGKYFDLEKGKLKGYPTDDAEMIDEGFKSKLKSYQIFNPEMFSDQQPKDE